MNDERRPMETEMAVLWQRLDAVSGILDHLVTFLVGSPRGFTLMIHPKDPHYATISTTNLTENIEAVREWLRHMDGRQQEPFDDPEGPMMGSLPNDHQRIQDVIARGDLVLPGALAYPEAPTAHRKKKVRKRKAAQP